MGQKSKRKIFKYLETNKKGRYQNLQDATKAVLREKFTVIKAHTKKFKEILGKQPNAILQRTQKRTNKAPSYQKEGNNKDRSGDEYKRDKKNNTKKKSMKLRAGLSKRCRKLTNLQLN